MSNSGQLFSNLGFLNVATLGDFKNAMFYDGKLLLLHVY